MAVILSKLFAEGLKHHQHTCHNILHPAHSCKTANWINFYQSLLSNGKYFAALVFVSIIKMPNHQVMNIVLLL